MSPPTTSTWIYRSSPSRCPRARSTGSSRRGGRGTCSSRVTPRTASSTCASRGIRMPLGADDLTGVVVHTDMTRTGWFRCSDERINRLHEAAVWSLRGNVCDIPTDCPTRERAGWTGDWQIFVPTAAFLYDVAGFTHQVAAGPGRRAVVERARGQPRAEPAVGVRGRLPRGDERVGGLGRRGRDRAVGDLPGVRRPPPARGAMALDGRVAVVCGAGAPRASGIPTGLRAGRSHSRTSATCGTRASTGASGWCPART